MALSLLAHAKVLAVFIVDDATGFMTVKIGWANDKIGHVERKESFTIETAWISLRQHECLADISLCIDVTEIWSREETVVAA